MNGWIEIEVYFFFKFLKKIYKNTFICVYITYTYTTDRTVLIVLGRVSNIYKHDTSVNYHKKDSMIERFLYFMWNGMKIALSRLNG